MPGLSIYERQGTTAENNLNADALGQYIRKTYANNKIQRNLMIISSILTQDAVARDIIGRDALLQRREAQLKELDDQLTRYYAEFGSVLNDKAIDFLNKMADVKVPTFTSILAGFENARASRAENERLRIAEMERLMQLDTKLQTEKLQLRREQIDNEMLAAQTNIKATQDLMANTNAANTEALKLTERSGTFTELPRGGIYHSPELNTQTYHTNFVDDRERIYGGRRKGANVADLLTGPGIDLGERPSDTTPNTGEAKQAFRLLGETPGHEFFIRDPNLAAPDGVEANRYHNLLLNLADTVEDYRRNSDGNSNYYETLVRENPDYIKALNYVLGTLQGGPGTTGPGLREVLLPQLLPGPDDGLYGKARKRILVPPGERGGWDLNNQAEAVYFLQHIWPQMLHISTELHNGNMKLRAAEQEPPKPDGTLPPSTVPATKATQGIPAPAPAQEKTNTMYFGPEPAARTVVGFNGTGVAPAVSQDGYQNEFAYTAASRVAPVQIGEGMVPVEPVQMGATVIPDATLGYVPDYNPYPNTVVDEDKEIGDELPQGVSRRRMDSGVWEFTYPDGRKVYSDNPAGPGGMRGGGEQTGSVTRGAPVEPRPSQTTGSETIYQVGNPPIYTNMRTASVLDPVLRNRYIPPRNTSVAPLRVLPSNHNAYLFGEELPQGVVRRMINSGVWEFTYPDGRKVYSDNPAGPGQLGRVGTEPVDQAYNVNLGARDESRAIPRVSGYTEVVGNPPIASRLQRIEGPNGPIYTNVQGGSVLDPNIRPVPGRRRRPLGYWGDRDLPQAVYRAHPGEVYRNPFSGEEGIVHSYSPTPGVVRVQRPDGSIYATNIDPNMNMGYSRPPSPAYVSPGLYPGRQVRDTVTTNNQGVVERHYPGTDVIRVRRPDGTYVDTNIYSPREWRPYTTTPPEYYPRVYAPYSDLPPYDPSIPPVRVNRY